MNKNDSCIVNLHRTILKDGPKFLSHKLIIKDSVAYLKPTITAMLFCIIYIVVGSFLLCIATYLLIFTIKYDFVIFVGGFGIAITTFGIALIQPFLRRANFDRSIGIFNNHKDHNVKLQHIVSIQINNKMIQRKNALSYPCYELNLLTEHGRRINILNHNDLAQLMHDAKLLGEFINVKVRDCRTEIIL